MTRKIPAGGAGDPAGGFVYGTFTTERTPPEKGFPAVHLGMVVPREALEKLKAAETPGGPPDGGADGRRDSGACGRRAFRRRIPPCWRPVTTDAPYIRRGGDWDAEALALVDYGTTVAVTGKSGGWYQVRYDGIEGYSPGNIWTCEPPA